MPAKGARTCASPSGALGDRRLRLGALQVGLGHLHRVGDAVVGVLRDEATSPAAPCCSPGSCARGRGARAPRRPRPARASWRALRSAVSSVTSACARGARARPPARARCATSAGTLERTVACEQRASSMPETGIWRPSGTRRSSARSPAANSNTFASAFFGGSLLRLARAQADQRAGAPPGPRRRDRGLGDSGHLLFIGAMAGLSGVSRFPGWGSALVPLDAGSGRGGFGRRRETVRIIRPRGRPSRDTAGGCRASARGIAQSQAVAAPSISAGVSAAASGWPRKASAAASAARGARGSIGAASVCFESFSPCALVATGTCR